MKQMIIVPVFLCTGGILASGVQAGETSVAMDVTAQSAVGPAMAEVSEADAEQAMSAAETSSPSHESLAQIERGRYLVTVSGCNDCHTDGYAQSGGMVTEGDRLLGGHVGFKGPWGTTYPSNLRLLVAGMDVEQWLVQARMERRPPMPWFNLRDARDEDLRAIYAYLRFLGPRGEEAPAYVPPDGKVQTAYILFVPQH